MNRLSIKKYFLLLTSLFGFSALAVVFACSYWDEGNYFFSFFAPEVSGQEKDQPFYRSNYRFYDDEKMPDVIHQFDAVNIDEWSTIFQNRVNRSDLEHLVYQASIGKIDSLIFYIKDNKYKIDSDLKANSILKVEPDLSKEFLYYLGYAKRCEPYVTQQPADWWDEPISTLDVEDFEEMRRLIAGGEKQYNRAKNQFIKQRYLFQNIRLNFYLNEYQTAIDKLTEIENYNSTNTIYYRSLGYIAGSFYKMENYGMANYLYAKIFANCETSKLSAFYSFHPQEEEDWNKTLTYAKTAQEKIVLWQMLGIYADPLRAMKEIYAINPKANELNVLLTRSINIGEESFLPQLYSKDAMFKYEAFDANGDFFAFVKSVADKQNSEKPYLWSLSAGYLATLKGDFGLAKTYFNRVKKESCPDAQTQSLKSDLVRMYELIATIEQYQKQNDKTENHLAKELKYIQQTVKDQPILRSQNLFDWSLMRLSQKYVAWGDSLKAQFLCEGLNPHYYAQNSNLFEMIALIDKSNKSDFEQFAIAVYPYDKGDLYHLIAVHYTYDEKLDDAINLLKKYPKAADFQLLGDPFMIHINDCHDCDHALPNANRYTMFEFLKKMKALHDEVSRCANCSPEKAFELANGFYNITHFGNARYFYQSPLYKKGELYLGWYDEKNEFIEEPYTQCATAEKYYNIALNNSTDKEFKAKCCFMAAKCEQNQYFMTRNYEEGVDFKSGKYFKQLKADYSKTKYYQEIINECGYFKTYLKGKVKV